VKELSLTQVGEHLKDKLGTLGRKIQIETNHMRVDLGSLTQVYRYDVSVQPEKKPKKMVRVAMELFRKSYFPQNHPSYDGQKLLYSAKPLPLPGDVVTGKVTIQTDRGEEQEFTITIKLTGTVDLSPLRHLLQKKNVGEDEAFQCVEVVFKQAYTSSFINVGRRFYFKSLQNEYLLGTGAQMYLGGYQAMSKGWVPFLNVDVAHKAFTVAIPLTELVVQMCNTRNRPVTLDNLKTFSLAPYHSEELNQYLKGFKVVYQIPNHPGSKKVYRINGLKERPSRMRFLQENQWVTVEEYFQTKWRCVLRYPNLPTLWVGNKKNIYLPLEYCVLQEGQPIDSSKMVKTQTSAMSNHSATSTTERKNKIQKIMQRAEHNQNPCVKEFGFSVGNGFQQVEGRVLDAPRLRYSEGTVEPRNGSWWAKKFLNGATIRKWRVVGVEIAHSLNSKIGDLIRMVSCQWYQNKTRDNFFVAQLISLGKTSGMTFSPPEATIFISNQKAALERCFQQNKSLQLLLVVLPNNKDSYFWVKQSAELTVGCLTQCVKCDTLFKLSETTVRNILLKINTKSNGLNHVVHDLKLVTDETCMVMGADVTHPSPQATAIPSVVAVTASEDLTATKYNISVDLQVPRQTMSEMIQNLETITVDKLRTFIARNNTPPARIYFFRDGVSEGEFDRVRDVEIKAILRACATVCKNRLPKLTFLVVQKRHHTRFFPTGRESTGEEKFRNVPVGTCVDRVITDPTLQNFYLQSHSSFKGVARPTKYWTLYDENKLTNDDVQALTFHLCHVFTRCNKSVSYPAPTYFAHLAADRAKGYLYKQEIRMEELNLDLVKIQKDFARANPMFFS
jgi:eukaryotic translation initiation factor 2C